MTNELKPRWLCLPDDGVEKHGTIYGHASEPFDPNEDADSDGEVCICAEYVPRAYLTAAEARTDASKWQAKAAKQRTTIQELEQANRQLREDKSMLLRDKREAEDRLREARERAGLAVWYGSMPESNGRQNWTASVHQVGRGPHTEGFCFVRSEYPDRVRYEADRMKWVLGIGPRPDILAYDADAHSGYVPAPTRGEDVAARERVAKALARKGAPAPHPQYYYDLADAALAALTERGSSHE